MAHKHRLIFFGTEDFSVSSLQRLIKDGWNIVAVVTKPGAPAGRNRQLKEPAVVGPAKSTGLRLLQPENLEEIIGELKELRPAAGVLVSYGKIIPQAILDLFPSGVINVHPSLLPKHRGPSPIETAILNGDKETGVSLIRLTAGMDEGPVYAQERLRLPSDIDTKKLSDKLAAEGAELLAERLQSILEGWTTPKPQIEADATYTQLIKKEDGVLDLKRPAVELERQVRAYKIWPRSRTKIHRQNVIVTKARVAKNEKDGDIVLKCNPGYLEVLELIGPSGKTMPAADFLRGYRSEH